MKEVVPVITYCNQNVAHRRPASIAFAIWRQISVVNKIFLNNTAMKTYPPASFPSDCPKSKGFTNNGVAHFKLRSRVFTLAPYHNSGLTQSKLINKRNRILSSASSTNTVTQVFDEPAHKR